VGEYHYNSELLTTKKLEMEDKYFRGENELQPDSPNMENRTEAGDALALVKAGLAEPNIFNSIDWHLEIADRFKDPHTTPTLAAHCMRESGLTSEYRREIHPHWTPSHCGSYELDSLNYYWEAIGDEEKRERRNNVSSTWSKTPVEAFTDQVVSGQYPTPEILLSVAKALQMYFLAGGDLSLEDVFFGKPVQKKGNFSKRRGRDLLYQAFHVEFKIETHRHQYLGLKRPTMANIADTVLVDLERRGEFVIEPDFDMETFLRGYRDWRKANIELADE